MLGKKAGSIAMSAVLAATLCPGLAMAAPLEAGQTAPEQAPATLSTQAKTATVWVLDGYGYDYNDNGLLNSYNGWTLKYNKKYKLASAKYESGYTSDTYSETYKINKIKNGKIVKATAQETNSYNDVTRKYKSVFKYSYNKYGLTKAKETFSSTEAFDYHTDKLRKSRTYTTKYKVNKKGYTTWSRTSSSRPDGSSTKGAVTTYKYNGSGYLKKEVQKKRKPTTYSYGTATISEDGIKTIPQTETYYDGSGKKQTETYDSWRSFKKITVPKAAVATIKAQQWSLINHMNNGTLPMGIYTYGYDY